ncbi:DUF3231 family protein [Caldibacillus lycopersici]|uniref:DUF3231 family protein n=1 Tax=Perspicuibacillus lycopersici TaxID=1325689 RepID=A0AAE3IV19_9BACI|nr:DUF3231 family protein [Perspicuibacillus lycopersici]MCU9614977.1 DUF3231 family protein [Perspicuibacillus lycopersici]
MNDSPSHNQMPSTEMGKLWATYMGNSMAIQVLNYYQNHCEDPEIKNVLADALKLCHFIIESITDFYQQDHFPIPFGFNEKDVNLTAPRLFSDEFYLHYLKYTSKAGMNLYSIAIPLMVREHIREFFIKVLADTVKLVTKVNELLHSKGYLFLPPSLPVPDKRKNVEGQSFLNGFFGKVRTLHALEVTHLYDNIENNVTSKALLLGFSQVAKNDKVKKFLIRGKELTTKHIELCSGQLHKDDLLAPSFLDELVHITTVAPFSDKLMLWHKIDMFTMKIRSYANALSLNGRRDISALYLRLLKDIGLYVEDGANIMIGQGWMEQIPLAIDRTNLHKN